MVRKESNDHEDSIHVIGFTTAEIWVMNHMIYIVIGGLILGYMVCIVMYFNDPYNMETIRSFYAWKLASVITILMIFSFRFLARNLCYRVEIDTANEKIRFFRVFNKSVVEAPIRSVEFRADKHFACFYNGERFTILNEYTKRISKVLPPGVEIQFSKNFFARLMRVLLR